MSFVETGTVPELHISVSVVAYFINKSPSIVKTYPNNIVEPLSNVIPTFNDLLIAPTENDK